uniref:MutL gene n=1 Tax=Vibrio cholerae TaxID=666 RepID=Q8VKZ3_VIBCL|nr:unnamed protein product [Vibrio cholerae]
MSSLHAKSEIQHAMDNCHWRLKHFQLRHGVINKHRFITGDFVCQLSLVEFRVYIKSRHSGTFLWAITERAQILFNLGRLSSFAQILIGIFSVKPSGSESVLDNFSFTQYYQRQAGAIRCLDGLKMAEKGIRCNSGTKVGNFVRVTSRELLVKNRQKDSVRLAKTISWTSCGRCDEQNVAQMILSAMFAVNMPCTWLRLKITDKYLIHIIAGQTLSVRDHPEVKAIQESFIHALPILIDPRWHECVPVNLYLHSCIYVQILIYPPLRQFESMQSVDVSEASIVWMNLEIPEHIDPRTGVLVERKRSLQYMTATEKIEESPVVRYRDYLLENLYIKDENGKIGGSPSHCVELCAKSCRLLHYLHRQRIVPISKTFRPFEFSAKKVRIRNKNKRAQHDMLSHLNGYHGKDIIVYTTGLTKPFKNIQKPQDADIRELRPLREDEKQALYRYLDVKNSSDTKALMLYLKSEVGLRLEELITFPASVVDKPKAKVVKVPIGERITLLQSKIDVNPRLCYGSFVRVQAKQGKEGCNESGLLRHNHLFVQSNGSIYAPNTIQSMWKRYAMI